ncbi:MAG: hypothetical protein WKF84_19790 [Pyrinomonadaceae bacterium]
MTDVFSNHSVAHGLRMLLHGPADVSQVTTRPALLNGHLQAFFRRANEREFGFADSAANRESRGRVAHIALKGDSTVDRKNIAISEDIV